MAFLKKAYATTMSPTTSTRRWGQMRTASGSGLGSSGLIEQASDILGAAFRMDDYLLTHCTIVASVDVEEAPNVKLGTFQLPSQKVLRKWADYLVTPETTPWINNNLDAFERQALLKSYPTFVGAHNFLEHVQLEEHSKGRVIDAAARDIGDSLYIDILVATERTHRDLIASIKEGTLGTLSMGCSIDNSTCTKCGNVATDEPQMCSHIRYEKGNYWYDELGKKRRIAELCGHHSIEPNAGINFIDASWVRVPAFTGAVLQTILEARELSPRMAKQVAQRLGLPPAVIDELGIRKAAFLKTSGPFDDLGDEEDAAPAEGEEAAPEEEPSSMKDFEDEVVEIVLDRAKKRIKEELGPKDSGRFVGAPSETIFKEAGKASREAIHNAGLMSLARVASSDIELINHTALYEKSLGCNYPVALYRASLKVGPYGRYKSASAFVEACKHVLRRMPSRPEAEMMLKIGKLLSLRRRTS